VTVDENWVHHWDLKRKRATVQLKQNEFSISFRFSIQKLTGSTVLLDFMAHSIQLPWRSCAVPSNKNAKRSVQEFFIKTSQFISYGKFGLLWEAL
jgi:hypothetical protein